MILNYSTIENHMVLPAADDEAYYASLGHSNEQLATIDCCTFCEQEITFLDYATEEDSGWIHKDCIRQRKEEQQGFSVIAFAGFALAAYIVLVLFVHFGLKWSGR